MFYSTKRQQFLIDQVHSSLRLGVRWPQSADRHLQPAFSQGYAFKVITRLEGLEKLPNLVFPTQKEQIELLESVLRQNESRAAIDTDMTQYGVYTGGAGNKRARDDGDSLPAAKRSVGSMVGLSGGQHMSYVEQNKSVKCVARVSFFFFSSSSWIADTSFSLLPAKRSRARRPGRSCLPSATSRPNRTARRRLRRLLSVEKTWDLLRGHRRNPCEAAFSRSCTTIIHDLDDPSRCPPEGILGDEPTKTKQLARDANRDDGEQSGVTFNDANYRGCERPRDREKGRGEGRGRSRRPRKGGGV